jgi:hypothetical protein
MLCGRPLPFPRGGIGDNHAPIGSLVRTGDPPLMENARPDGRFRESRIFTADRWICESAFMSGVA